MERKIARIAGKVSGREIAAYIYAVNIHASNKPNRFGEKVLWLPEKKSPDFTGLE